MGAWKMTPYNKEQHDAITMVAEFVLNLPAAEVQALKGKIGSYLRFREAVDTFLASFFGEVCTQKCYTSDLSACCTREGIITFFADVVINILVSGGAPVELLEALEQSDGGTKCVYLGKSGCLWQVAPIVCKMFLCDPARKEVFDQYPEAVTAWEALKQQEKTFRWPDQPVLFDALEQYFLDAGADSPLMYLHNSPGLLRVKRLAALNPG